MLSGIAPALSRSQKATLVASAVVVLAGIIKLAESHPAAVLGLLLAIVVAIAVVLFPVATIAALLFLVPFHTAILFALQKHLHLRASGLDYWKDGLIVAVFLRAILGQLWEERRLRLPRAPGNTLLLFYVAAYSVLALLLSPHGAAGIRGLARDVEGPLLFLAIVILRPTRKQLWLCVGAALAACTVLGATALIERFGPQARFLTWYGAQAPTKDSSFYTSTGVYRAGSFFDSPLSLSFYLAGAAPFALALTALRTRLRPIVALAFAAGAGGLIVTLTRSAFVGGFLAILIAISLVVHNPRIRFSLIGIILIAGMSVLFLSRGNETFTRTSENSAHTQALKADYLRLVARPLGYGLGTTDELASRFQPQTSAIPGTTESTIMAKALEGGLEGVLLYLIVIYATLLRLRSARNSARRAGDKAATYIAAGAMAAMIGVFFSGLFLGIQQLPVEVAMWGPAGVAIAFASGSGRIGEHPLDGASGREDAVGAGY